ncbi:MAG: peptidoglycan DD-metalloendopeptidase family protein [Oscillospiraceae bacterium]|nr:peptidoglycan DD-metalloendopeptidase family protein [Oscillospiraceae bacterium]
MKAREESGRRLRFEEGPESCGQNVHNSGAGDKLRRGQPSADRSDPAAAGQARDAPASSLRFEGAPEPENPAPAPTVGSKLRQRRAQAGRSDPAPAEPPADAPSSRLRFEDASEENPPAGAEAPPSCGQNVHNRHPESVKRDRLVEGVPGCNSGGSGKLRQDGEKPRPSDRLRRDKDDPPRSGDGAAPEGTPAADHGGGDPPDGPRPAGKKAAREQRRFDKSGRRVEKSGARLDKARDKLAAQKPPKKGLARSLGKAVGNTAKFQSWRYVHGKVREVEHENVGIEAGHKVELAGEGVVRGGTRFVKKRIRTRPARQVRKWEQKNIKFRADHDFRKLAKQHPDLNKNALSRMWNKRQLKKKYQKEARKAAKKGAQEGARLTKRIAVAVGRAVRAVVRFVIANPKVLLILAVALVIIFILYACANAGMTVASGIAGAAGGSSYLAEDEDINSAELAYSQWEADLTVQAWNAPQSHPGYDEYRFSIDETGHDAFALMAFLTAKFDDFTFTQVEPYLREVFEQQYTLTFTRIVEVRYRYETDSDGNTHRVAYNYYILEVDLTARDFLEVIMPLLEEGHEEDRYDIYDQSHGNRQYVRSPFPFNWLPYVSSYYGYRADPFTGATAFHRGIDIALPTGTEILAGGGGVVLEATTHSLYGLTVRIDYGNGVTARYSHCNTLLVSTGQTVEAGDVIAHVGQTGNATGPHLDLEVMKDGELLNPLYFVECPLI